MTGRGDAPALRALLRRLLRHVGAGRRSQFALMLALTLACSFAEVVSLGAVVPFIGILTQPEKVFGLPAVAGFARLLGVESAPGLVLPLAAAFALMAIAAAALRLSLLWVSIRLANDIGADLCLEIYRRTLYQPYAVHVSRNSSQIISGITQKAATATSVLISLVSVVNSAVLFAAILAALLAIEPVVAASAIVLFGSGYALIAWQLKRRLAVNSRLIAREQTQVLKALQEGLGSIRDVLLDGSQAVYCDVYYSAIRQLQRADGENTFMNQFPRYAIEALGMVLVALLSYVLSRKSGGIGAALPIMGAMALGAQRLLPLLQQVYGNWTVVAGSQGALIDVLELLEQPLPKDAFLTAPAPLEFRDAIRFEGVRFRYAADGPWVLDGVDLTVPKGARVGFVGGTGSGKSTAVDLLMALLEPTQGRVLVDGRPITDALRPAWQRAIAHVPQSIFLADASVAENIAFGVPPEGIDMARVERSAAQARIADFIAGRPGGYGACVGERGIRLSGGQRQRIGIARALYKQASVLVFDEATSALDSETEKEVMSAVESLSKDLTILIIAHRVSTLKHCDTIVQMERGRMVVRGSYEQFVHRGAEESA